MCIGLTDSLARNDTLGRAVCACACDQDGEFEVWIERRADLPDRGETRQLLGTTVGDHVEQKVGLSRGRR